MNSMPSVQEQQSETGEFYRNALLTLIEAGIPFVLGGTFAMTPYTGIERDTKDVDVFIQPADRDRALDAFDAKGYRTEIPFSHWLAKVYHDKDFVDLIFSSGNGIADVDHDWFDNAPESDVMGLTLKVCPPEEIIWTKAFIMERERFDGADVAHLLRASGQALDWDRLLRRFGSQHWRVLYAHLILFGYIYPNERNTIPTWVMAELTERLLEETQRRPEPRRVCQGTFLSRLQYVPDTEDWGYEDARTLPSGTMSEDQAVEWTEAGKEALASSFSH